MDIKRLVLVSNRLPIVLGRDEQGDWRITPGSGGLVTALAPVLRDRGGVWIGWLGAEVVDGLEALLAETAKEAGYTLIPVGLTPEELDYYYYGFSNEILWPMFHDLVSHCKSLAKMMQAEFLGALLRPHGVILEMAEKHMPEKTAAVYEAARKAGKELVEKGRISPELEEEVAQEMMPREAFVKAMNDFFHKAWDSALEKESE